MIESHPNMGGSGSFGRQWQAWRSQARQPMTSGRREPCGKDRRIAANGVEPPSRSPRVYNGEPSGPQSPNLRRATPIAQRGAWSAAWCSGGPPLLGNSQVVVRRFQIVPLGTGRTSAVRGLRSATMSVTTPVALERASPHRPNRLAHGAAAIVAPPPLKPPPDDVASDTAAPAIVPALLAEPRAANLLRTAA